METDIELPELADEDVLALSLKQPSAFAALVDRYQDVFLRKAYAVVRSREEAEDIVQEAFTKIYLHGGSFQKQEGASFKSWAFKILLNTSFTHYQKRKRERGVRSALDPEIFEMLPDLKQSDFERLGLTDYVASIVSRMPLELGRALTEHFIEGLPQAEIASREGVSVGAIKTRVHRAKKVFRELAATLS